MFLQLICLNGWPQFLVSDRHAEWQWQGVNGRHNLLHHINKNQKRKRKRLEYQGLEYRNVLSEYAPVTQGHLPKGLLLCSTATSGTAWASSVQALRKLGIKILFHRFINTNYWFSSPCLLQWCKKKTGKS